jgi:hypothetical protein
MTDHLDDEGALALASGEAPTPAHSAHVESCSACARRVAELRDLLERLDRLPEAAASPRGLWSEIGGRIGAGAVVDAEGTEPIPRSRPEPKARARPRGDGSASSPLAARPPVRWAIRAAAGGILFLAGMAVQAARNADPLAREATPGTERAALQAAGGVEGGTDAPAGPLASGELALAAEIQRAGTEYVTAIARLAEDAPTLPAQQIDVGRQVAYAAIFGATHELASLAGVDPAASAIHEQARRAWYAGADGEGE